LDQSLQWLPIAQRLGIRFFGHAHGYDVSRRLREEKWRTEYLRYNESGGIIAMNQVARARLVALGISEFKIHVIPYGVDVPNEPKERVAKEMLRCLAVGRMVPKKAPILTLDAFRRAVEACPTLRLDYVGTGELLPAARQFVQAFDLGDKVTLHREQPSEVVDRLMGESDIFLQHSMTDPDTGNEEGLPVAILEAMAQSLPVVSTRHAGIPEAVIDGVTGCLVDEGDSITMGERIISLARDHNLRLKFGAAGWQCAKERFTWEIERASLLEVMGFAK
jgi:glycosyltransferase involved in cell wall biosynthesis